MTDKERHIGSIIVDQVELWSEHIHPSKLYKWLVFGIVQYFERENEHDYREAMETAMRIAKDFELEEVDRLDKLQDNNG